MTPKRIFLLALLVFFASCTDNGDDPGIPDVIPEVEDAIDLCISADEKALYDLIMDYRFANGLGSIPLSLAMTKTAQAHATDLKNNASNFASECNNHSWSDDGVWNGCCYLEDHSDPNCMWDKPQEIAGYESEGFEIVSWGFGNNAGALELWQNSGPHDAVILNLGIWESVEWNAIGVGMDGIYACAWFGKVSDLDGVVDECP